MSAPRPANLDQAIAIQVDAVAAAANSASKRFIDFTVAGLLLLFMAPLFAGIALAIILDSPGPAFFLQRRTGLGGRTFRICKFRTMTVMEDGADLRHACVGDERVTRIGRFLRRSHLDELPQLFNVVKGEMALVGPRPHALAHDERYSSAFPSYYARFLVRPGLTGLAQVTGYRGEVLDLDSMRRRVEADIQYVMDWSLELDFLIALKTVPLMIDDPKGY